MLLQIKNVSKHYNKNETVTSAVDSINFAMELGDFICIIGKHGSGKTTLMKMLSGLMAPTQGTITINNVNLFNLDDQQVSNFRNQNLGIIPQTNSLLPNLTALENIQLPFYLTFRGGQRCSTMAKDMMQKARISHLQETYPDKLTLAELRKVAIIRSLICSPKLILADEPTQDLDDKEADDVMRLFTDIYLQGTAVLITTSDNKAASHSPKVVQMSEGKLLIK